MTDDLARAACFQPVKTAVFYRVRQGILIAVTLIWFFGEKGEKRLIVFGDKRQKTAAFFTVHLKQDIVKKQYGLSSGHFKKTPRLRRA
jgi:hypothetical protein